MDFKLQRYIPLLDFLSLIFGKKTEIVLQDLTQGLDRSVIYIKNSLSGRRIGSPATDFVLEVYQSNVENFYLTAENLIEVVILKETEEKKQERLI